MVRCSWKLTEILAGEGAVTEFFSHFPFLRSDLSCHSFLHRLAFMTGAQLLITSNDYLPSSPKDRSTLRAELTGQWQSWIARLCEDGSMLIGLTRLDHLRLDARILSMSSLNLPKHSLQAVIWPNLEMLMLFYLVHHRQVRFTMTLFT